MMQPSLFATPAASDTYTTVRCDELQRRLDKVFAGRPDAEPWQMTAAEWEQERESLRGRNIQTDYTRTSGSEAATRIRALERLLYGVHADASRIVRDHAAALGAGNPSPYTVDEARAARDRLDTYITHRHVVAKALMEGQPVPPEVLADYPDLT